MKNAIAALSIPFLFFIVLKLLNAIVCWVFECTFVDLFDGAIAFTCFVSFIFTLAFYINVFEWLNKK